MIKAETYIVCNSSLVPKFKTISAFKMNLGQKLITDQQQFLPNDVKIQKHFIFYRKIINLIGYIGTLSIYTDNYTNKDEIVLYNDNNELVYKLDDNMSLYDNINLGLQLFFKQHGLVKDVETKVEDKKDPAPHEYVKPDKPLSEMTEAERIQYARNIK